jgi:hypothetical protein
MAPETTEPGARGAAAGERGEHMHTTPVRWAAARLTAMRGERGDVPGWVLVTLMTAGLVILIWGVAGDRLTEVFNSSMDSVVDGP